MNIMRGLRIMYGFGNNKEKGIGGRDQGGKLNQIEVLNIVGVYRFIDTFVLIRHSGENRSPEI